MTTSRCTLSLQLQMLTGARPAGVVHGPSKTLASTVVQHLTFDIVHSSSRQQQHHHHVLPPFTTAIMAPKPMRLPPMRVLRVRNPNKDEANPCLPVMSSVLGECTLSLPPSLAPFLPSANQHARRLACWASTGAGSAACATVEQSLRACMDGPPPPARKKNNINYHLSRFQKYLEGNTHKKNK